MRRIRTTKFVVGLIAVAVFFCGLTDAFAAVRVRGYTRKDGTRVQSHYRSNPDGNFRNNWSTRGNVNPYTGRVGTLRSPPANYGDDVSVNGYFRSDGTYVQPHMRSSPDSNFYNNWSTSSNTNPYTGARGTLQSPPVDNGSGFAGLSTGEVNSTRFSDENLRQSAAERLQRQGHSVDWEKHSLSYMHEMSARISAAERVKRQGHPVNWQDYSLSELQDMSARISAGERLKQKGISVNWQDRSLTELIGDLMEASR